MNESRRQILLDTPHTETATGAIASFETDMVGRAKEVRVEIEAVQDLNGYENPWPAGGGKNLLLTSFSDTTINGTTITRQTDGKVATSGVPSSSFNYTVGTVTLPAGSYILNGAPSGGGSNKYFLQVTNTPVTTNYGQDSGSGVSFTLAQEETVTIRIQMYTGASASMTFAPMIRLSSVTDETYAPYSNICPISGWTGVNVETTGKNMLDPATIRNGYYVRAGNASESSPLGSEVATSSWSCSDFIPVLASAQYTTIAPRYTSASAAGLVFYDESKNAISGVTTNQQRDAIYTFTTPSNCKYVRFSWNNADGDNALIAAGIATSYEPYSGSTIPISWSSSAGTVYGGYLTWLWNGTVKLTKTMASVDMGDIDWTAGATSNYTYYTHRFDDKANNYNFISSMYKTVKKSRVELDDKTMGVYNTTNARMTVAIRDDTYVDASAFKAAMSGVQLVYELATPVTYTLTPQQALVFLRGTNNVWNDINDTTVTYWTHKTGDSV